MQRILLLIALIACDAPNATPRTYAPPEPAPTSPTLFREMLGSSLDAQGVMDRDIDYSGPKNELVWITLRDQSIGKCSAAKTAVLTLGVPKGFAVGCKDDGGRGEWVLAE